MSGPWQVNEELISEMINKIHQKRHDEQARHEAKMNELAKKLTHMVTMRDRVRQGLPVYLTDKKV